MINHGKVRSTIKPESMVIDEYSVWIHEDIQEHGGNHGVADDAFNIQTGHQRDQANNIQH